MEYIIYCKYSLNFILNMIYSSINLLLLLCLYNYNSENSVKTIPYDQNPINPQFDFQNPF